MLDKADAIKEELIRLRRTIHMHPELGFEELQTSSLVAETLSELGIEHQAGVGKTGVVARLGNGEGPVIGIRADMDALPIEEANDVPYRSQTPGKMHACGHDAHTAMLLGVARLLRDEAIGGEIRLLFQPSEERADAEGVSGAPRMIDDGAIDGLDAVISLHVDSGMDRGKVSIKEGYTLANTNRVFATVTGKGGHGAYPHLADDPVFMMGPILTALNGIVSRRVKPIEPAVVTIGLIEGGSAFNIIPGDVRLEITLRSATPEVRQQLLDEVERALSIARALGGDYSMSIVPGYPSLYNDPQVTGWLRETATQLIGSDNVLEDTMAMYGEDFSFMAQASKGAMINLGTKDPNGPPRFHHHPEFDIDEEALPIGTAILAQTALRFIKEDLG